MGIISAVIPASGWYVELTLACGPGSWSAYQFGTDAAPTVTLLTNRLGFQPASDGTVSAAIISETLSARDVLRNPMTPSNIKTKVLGETPVAPGVYIVRLSLSETVYATDTSLALTVAAGWRTGEAATTVFVTNNSAVLAPVPIVRWADVPFQLVRGGVTLELKGGSHHPFSKRGLAAVRFDVTDGLEVRTLWSSSTSVSPKYRGRTQVYSAAFDAATLAGLQPGLLRCDYHTYPWIGTDRSSDPAGTKSMAGLANAPLDGGAQQPQVIAYDPSGSRYQQPIVYVDESAGSDTPGGAKVSTDDEVAYAGTAAKSVIGAVNALAAALHAGGATTPIDSAIIRLKPGVHNGLGSARLMPGITALESWVSIEGDPRASPSAVILKSTLPPTLPNALFRFANMQVQINNQSLVTTGGRGWWLDGIEIRGAPGTESNNAAVIRSVNPSVWITNVTWWNHGSSPKYSATQSPRLIRDSSIAGQMQAPLITGTDYLPPSPINLAPAPTGTVLPPLALSDPRLVQDVIVEDCFLPKLQAGGWAPPRLIQGPGLPALVRRVMFTNNTLERIGASPQPITAIGEKEWLDVGYVIIEANHFLGERVNALYDDPNAAVLADTYTLSNSYTVIRVANNVFEHAFQKNDNFDDPDIAALRRAAGVAGANGVRPQCTGSWPITYGVGFRDNVDLGRHPMSGLFRFEDLGPGNSALYGAYPGFVRDACQYGSNQGLGDYRPAPGSLLLARATTTNCSFDRAGVPRPDLFAVGALEGA